CTDGSGTGGHPRCPANSFSTQVSGDTLHGGHSDEGSVLFNPNAVFDACPVAMSSDGGVFVNTVSDPASCQDPRWQQSNVGLHALWLEDMAGLRANPAEMRLYIAMLDNSVQATTSADATAPTWRGPLPSGTGRDGLVISGSHQ